MLFVVCFCSTFTIVLTSTPGKLSRSVKILNERFTGSKYLQIAPWCTDKLGDDKCLFHAGPANRAQRVARSYLCKFQRLLFFSSRPREKVALGLGPRHVASVYNFSRAFILQPLSWHMLCQVFWPKLRHAAQPQRLSGYLEEYSSEGHAANADQLFVMGQDDSERST